MTRILRDAGGQLDLLTYNTSDALADVNGTIAPTLVVTDSAGTTIAGFTGARASAGTYSSALPANLEVLDAYEVVWSWPNGQSRRSEFELVGGFLFTVAELQAADPALSTLTAAQAVLYRDAVEDVFEDETITNRAFRPKGRRLVRDGTGTDRLVVPDNDILTLVSAKVDGIALTAPQLAAVKIASSGLLVRTSGAWNAGASNVELLYEYGMRSTPAKVKLEALKFAKSLKLVSPVEDGRATAVFTDIGGYRLTIPGRDGPTGIPSVDQTLDQYSRAQVGGMA